MNWTGRDFDSLIVSALCFTRSEAPNGSDRPTPPSTMGAARRPSRCDAPSLGIDRASGCTITVEVGADLSSFPKTKHLATWAVLCLGNPDALAGVIMPPPVGAAKHCVRCSSNAFQFRSYHQALTVLQAIGLSASRRVGMVARVRGRTGGAAAAGQPWRMTPRAFTPRSRSSNARGASSSV